jgi:hypothetical protein
VSGTYRWGELFTLDVPGGEEQFTLKAMGMKFTVRGTPADDCRVHLQRVSDGAVLASSVIADKDDLGGLAGQVVMTNLPPAPEVIMDNGAQYRIYLESTSSVSGNDYVLNFLYGGSTSDFPEALESTFQTDDSHVTYSLNGTTWYRYNYVNGIGSDAVFELELETRPSGTVIMVF